MISHINVSSRKAVQISTKLSNTPKLFTHTAMRILNNIFLTGAPPPQQLTSSMVPSINGARINNMKHPKSVPMRKQ